MSRLYWDAMLFVYLLEANPVFGNRVQRMHDGMARRGDVLCTSIFTVAEVLTGPRRRNDMVAVNGLKKFFSGREIEILPFTLEAADRYSIIRAETRVRPADAIHLATAASAGVDMFVTNDGELQKQIVPGIRFFADLDGRVI